MQSETLTGKAVDESGRPVPYGSVYMETNYAHYKPDHNYPTAVTTSALTDVHGNFEIYRERGEITSTSFLATMEDLATPEPVRLQGSQPQVVLKKIKWTNLIGKVVDPRGYPVAGAHVFLQHYKDWFRFNLLGQSLQMAQDHSLDFVAETDAKGLYHFDHLLPGMDVYVFANRDRFGAVGHEVVLNGLAPTAPQIQLPFPDSFVDGQVVDTSGQPVPEALVSVVPLTGFKKADRQGKFHITGVPAGTAQVHVMKGWAEADAYLTAGSSGNKVKIRLLPQTKTNPAYSNEEP